MKIDLLFFTLYQIMFLLMKNSKVIAQKSQCSIENYQVIANQCNNCSFKCQICNAWQVCIQCQPGYSLFTTLDQRVICVKVCKTLWVTDSSGNSYLQGFFIKNGKCISCQKGCLNCNDNLSCFECGNYRTGISIQDQQKCEVLVPGSCPIGTGFEKRIKRCLDCSYASSNYQTATSVYPIDPLVCQPTDIYQAKYCPQKAFLLNGLCINSQSAPPKTNPISIQELEKKLPIGCMQAIYIPSVYCYQCSPNYYYTLNGSQKMCSGKSNNGVGNCPLNSLQVCDKCSQNEALNLTEAPYNSSDPARQDIDDQDPSMACNISIQIRQRYSYNIDETVCKSLQGFLFPPTNPSNLSQKQVCLTTCPSSIDDQGQYINYYTQWKTVTLDSNQNANVQGTCVTQCSEGYAIDEQNKQCQQCTTSVPNCSRCSITNLNQCIACKQGYYLTDLGTCVSSCSNISITKNGILYCLACNIKNCISCSSSSQCNQCLYYFDPITNCSTCAAGYSQLWNDSSKCIVCNTQSAYFYVKDQICHETCGKGYRINDELQCDDGNLINGDGCDSNCKIEPNFKCSGGSPTSKDVCYKIDVDEAIQQNTDPNFKFYVSFNVTKQGQPLVQIVFTQQPIINPNIPLNDVFQISISSLNPDQYSYSIKSISSRFLQLNDLDNLTIKQKQKQAKQMENYKNNLKQRRLQNIYGFNVFLQLNNTLKNQQVIVQVNQTQIKNQNGKLLYKNQEVAPIQNYVYVSSEDKKQADQIATAAQSTQVTIAISGLSFAVMNNFYSLMAIVDITELIYYFLFLDIEYPKNVFSFFQQFDNFQMPFLPNPFENYVEDVKQNCNPHVYSLDTDSLFLRNSGTNIFAICLFFGFLIAFRIIQILLKKILAKCEKFNSFMYKCAMKLQYNISIEVVYVVFLNFCASSFLQFQDTTVSDSTEKEHTAELVNIIVFSICFLGLFAVPTSQLIFLYRNRKIIEFDLENYESQIETSINLESPQVKRPSSHTLQEKQKERRNMIIKNLKNCDETCKEKQQRNNDECQNPNENKIKQTSKLQNEMSDNQLDDEQIKKLKLAQEHIEFLEKWEAIIVGMKTSNFKFYCFNVITYYRKMIIMAIIMCLMDYTEIQVQLLVFQHICVAVYITKYMPFEKFAQNIINILSEILFILLELFVIRLSSQAVDQADQDERNHIGLWIICFFLSIIGIHILLMIYETIHKIYEIIHDKIGRKKHKILSIVVPQNKQIEKQEKNIDSGSNQANNSIIMNKKTMQESNIQKQNQENKITQEPKTIQFMESFATNIRTPQNMKVYKSDNLKLNIKDTSPLSEEGAQINKKSSSDDDYEADDFEMNVISKNNVNGFMTPTSTLPIKIKNSRRRSTKTQDQTPFGMKSNRLSVIFKNEPGQQTFNEQVKAHLKIPCLQEIHECSSSPTNQNSEINQKETDRYKNFQHISQLNSANRDSQNSLNQKEESTQEKIRQAKSRPRNVSRFSLINIQSDNQLVQSNTQIQF
ncbi:myxococcus cysteine-rich repeat protein (macronuclear) [Tetrahymena thermophila SB210]|uniref:Myxococcus cysteine-rich repeat protein n=1 Tax=Tetrahymena thermophila (strain SB210) TaxID=312017 RepID=Q22LM5_TETTS|nr:myxococcus cysteine-rich repeat protein [Tetrahymena thermophila SB210]EAR86241.2 myxococcus cysteine-rich repeat protein [Tetrahymena thermophila SB210]|eukprot:XP_976836.2 myxococcus cysteine-rich repeat protein [Tetrahymena thermophila SB210]